MGCGNESDDLERIAEALTDYLLAHRQAADTLDGIRDWWLPRDRFMGVRADALQLALDKLVVRGELARVESAGGIVLYVNRAARPLH